MDRPRPITSGFRTWSQTLRGRRKAAAACIAGILVGTLAGPASASASADEPVSAACPTNLAGKATCYTGQDANGAYYAIAIPKEWNGSLVVHAHGGPDLGAGSDPERSVGDLERWSVMVDEGYAWAGSSYRRGGYGTRMAAADTENLRRLFVGEFGTPKRTYVHGQSWGGNVAAKVVETYGARKHGPYDGALLTNGVLGGGSRGYDYRVDLRVVYQYYCQNHPRPTEPQYPLWEGLRATSTMTAAGLRARLQECTGYASAPQERTAPQQRNLDDILAVTGVPERTLESHLRFATFTFRDIVHERLGGRNPFTNIGVSYRGSDDDLALNRSVRRYAANPSARRDLRFDSDLTGSVSIPVLSLHALDDPTAFVEHESAYRATLQGAGSAGHLVQAFTSEAEHSALSDSEYATAIDALRGWVRDGVRPTRSSLAAACPVFDAAYDEGCYFDTTTEPGSYFSRVYPRPGDTDWPAMTEREYRTWDERGDVGIAY
jgi:hypothetical protein